eukprot:1317311-Ditylum_brightwellii.AAC.1
MEEKIACLHLDRILASCCSDWCSLLHGTVQSDPTMTQLDKGGQAIKRLQYATFSPTSKERPGL